MTATLGSQLAGVVALLAVSAAPVPLLIYLTSSAGPRARIPLSPTDRILAALVLWAVVQGSVVVLLGWLGRLRFVNILFLEVVVLACGLASCARAGSWRSLASVAEPADRGRIAASRPAPERWLIAVACGFAVVLTLRVLALPVSDWDSLDYQLPRVAEWYQQASFARPLEQHGPADHPINSYPYSWSALLFIGLASAGHDQFVLLPNLLAWLILGLATYSLGRVAGARRFAAILAAVLIAVMPLSLKSVSTAHNDLPLGAFFVASVYFTMRAWRYRCRFSQLVAVAGLGMLLGTKMSGIPYAALVLLLSVWLFWHSRRGSWPVLERGQPVLIGLAVLSVGLLGGSWYVRNVLATGNPLGFLEISVFGRIVFTGSMTRAWVDETTLLHRFFVSNLHHWNVLRQAFADFLGLPALLLIALGAGTSVGMLRRPRGRPVLVPLLLVCAAAFYFYVAGPWSATYAPEAELTSWMGEEMRYSFPFWGILAALAAGAVRARRRGEWLLAALATLAAVIFANGGIRFSKQGVLVLAIAGLVLLADRESARRRVRDLLAGGAGRTRLGVAVTVVVAVAVITCGTWAARGVRYRLQDEFFGGLGRLVDGLDPGARIGFWECHASYLLYGKRIQRPLTYLALGAQHDADEMLRYLRAQPVDVIAVGPRSEYTATSPVWDWLVEKAGEFDRLSGEDLSRDVIVYRLRAR